VLRTVKPAHVAVYSDVPPMSTASVLLATVAAYAYAIEQGEALPTYLTRRWSR